jgi:hypothetical protein
MDETQIAELIKLIENAKMPEWWKEYAGQIAYNLQVHTKGLMFDKVTGLYPNENPESQKHCVNSYESITKGSIWKAINNIIRVFNNSSYNLQISDKTKAVVDQYQDKEGSFFSQFLEDWIKNSVATDPNGICVAYPPEYSDDLYRYVCHKDIVAFPTDDILIFISELESEKKYEFCDTESTREIFFDYENLDGRANVRHGTVKTYNRRLETKYLNTVYHVFTKTHFIRFFKTEAGQTQWEYEYIAFNKELDTLPYFENGGVEIEYDVYESFVQSFVPFGNLALMSHRNQRAIDLMFAYPRMSEVQTECDSCQGQGWVTCETGKETCHRCRGSKYISIQSPYKVYRKVPNENFDPNNEILKTPSVEFYTPPVGIIDYTSKQWQQYISLAEMAVFVQQKVETGNVQAAKSKEIDREELYAWLANISKVLYNNLQMFLQYLENYVSSNPITVTVERPYSFAILTESEAFIALDAILTSPAPIAIKANNVDNFVNKFISESSPVKRALSILKKYDLLLYYSDDELTNLKGLGIIDSMMLQKHTLAYPVIIKLYEQDNNLFNLEDDQIIVKMDQEMLKYPLGQSLRTAIINSPQLAQTA